MNLLAIDCASPVLSISVSRGEEIFCSETEAGMKHSEIVMDCIDGCIKEAALKPKDLNGVLCMGGPGSFTGLRIGYSAAKGLALSLSIPFAPVPSLDCIAHSSGGGFVLASIQAGKGAFFYAFYREGEKLQNGSDGKAAQIAREIEVYSGNGAQKIILCGPASLLLYESLPEELKKCIFPVFKNKGYSKELIFLAKKRKLLDNETGESLYSGPDYCKPSV